MEPVSNLKQTSSQDIAAHAPQDEVRLKRRLGLFNGVAVIAGTIIGSGIFVAPKGVLMESGSVGVALLVWGLSGVICLFAALVFTELGTCITTSGGAYAYIRAAFGGFPSFLYLWTALLILFPVGNAVIGLTFAYYILQPFYVNCELPGEATKLVAALVIALLTFVNCASVKWSARTQDVLAVLKTLALVLIIVTGVVALCKGQTGNFSDAFASSSQRPGGIALAFYSGLFSYAGWDTLNFMTEELRDPYKNFPRAIWISVPAVTAIYVLTNVAYFAVLTSSEILASEAVAVTFADRMFGVMAWIIPISVALSTLGALNGCILAASRMFFVGARQGHLPEMTALINIKHLTPLPAVLIEGITSIVFLAIDDVYLLINYAGFAQTLASLACVMSLLYLRRSQPDLKRPFKVNIVIALAFVLMCLFLLLVPVVTNPMEIVVSMVIILSGVPVYCLFVLFKHKPKGWRNLSASATKLIQKLTVSVPQEGSIDGCHKE